MQLQHRLSGSQQKRCSSPGSSVEGCTIPCNSTIQAYSRTQLQDMCAGPPDTFKAVKMQHFDFATKESVNSHAAYSRHAQQQQQQQAASHAPSALLPQLQLQPEFLQEIEKAVKKAVVNAVAKLACNRDQQESPVAAAAAASGAVWLAAQQQQLDADAAAIDQRSAYVRQFLAADSHAACGSHFASTASPWTDSSTTPATATQTGLQVTWQEQQQLPLLPLSPVLSSRCSLGELSNTSAVSVAASFRGSPVKMPAAAAAPAPLPPTATPHRPAPVRRRTFSCMQHLAPARSAAAASTATAPITPSAVGSVLEAPWATAVAGVCTSFPQHLLPNILARASSTGDIATFPAGISKAARRNSNSSSNSCCSRLSDCSSGFASSRSSNDGASTSSTSSSPVALPMPSALDACSSCVQLQPLPAAVAATAASPGHQLLLLQPLQLQPPSIPVRQPPPPQEPPSAAGVTPGKISPRVKFICLAAPPSPFAAAPAGAAAGRSSGGRFAPVAPPRAPLQRGACGGAELRANVGHYRRLSTSMSGLAGEASSMSDGAIGTAGSVLDSAGFGGADRARFRWSGCSLDGRILGRMPSSPAASACDGGGAAVFAAAMAVVNAGAAGMTRQ